ncbi:MAG: NTP transferase domain-containing protein [Kofleriaceae bacterium]
MPAEAVLVALAAGRGARLGGRAKALLQLGGESYLARICATARAAGVERGVVMVAAPFAAEVSAEARRLGLEVVVNPAPERGMASSVELGFAWAEATGAAEGLLWPCDHPAVAAGTVRALRAALADGEAAIPRVGGRGGHPALVARRLFAALARCSGEPEGARSVLRAAAARHVDVEDAGCIVDVDRAADARELERRWEPG